MHQVWKGLNDSVNQIVNAIESRNDAYLRKFPGIGQKASQQIILDLRGKLNFTLEEFSTKSNSKLDDVEEALVSLGYNKKELKKVLAKLDTTSEIGDLIKDALQILAKM
jgi:Holliday junction DNA helicase RuvA